MLVFAVVLLVASLATIALVVVGELTDGRPASGRRDRPLADAPGWPRGAGQP